MRCEAVAQRVRRRGIGKAERVAQCLHLALHDTRVQRAAARPDKEWAVGSERIGAGGEIVCYRVTYHRQNRHEALLAAFAGNRHEIAARRLRTFEAERFRDAQAAAVEERQEGDIALRLPDGCDEPRRRFDKLGGNASGSSGNWLAVDRLIRTAPVCLSARAPKLSWMAGPRPRNIGWKARKTTPFRGARRLLSHPLCPPFSHPAMALRSVSQLE